MENEATKSANQHFNLAYKCFKMKEYSAAYYELHLGLADEPESIYGHRTLLIVASKLKYYQEVMDECLYLLRNYGRFDVVDGHREFTLRSDVLIPSPEFTSAFTLLEKLANSELRLGRKDKSEILLRQSILDFNRILAFDPDYTWASSTRAWCYIALNEFDLAEAILKKDSELHSDLVLPYIGLTRLNASKRSYFQTVRYFFTSLWAFAKNINLYIRSQKSRYHFASETEADIYFAKHLITNPFSDDALKHSVVNDKL